MGKAAQVNVSGRSLQRYAPGEKDQCAFDDELLSMFRLGQAVKKTFVGIILENFLEGTSAFPGLVSQTTMDGCRQVFDFVGHSKASR